MELLEKLTKEFGRELYSKMKEPDFFVEKIIMDQKRYTITPYQKEWLQLATEHKRLNIAAFRSSGKTESLFIDYPIYRAFIQPGFKGIVISDSIPQSVRILKEIRDTIVQNEVLRTAIPTNRYSTWSKTQIELKNGSEIKCKPYSDKIRGEHVDFVGCDEAGEYQNHEIFLAGIIPIVVAKGGNMIVCGTYKHKLDLLHKLEENSAWKSLRYSANMEYQGKLLWDWRYPEKSLKQVKEEIGNNLHFTREYLLKVMSADTQLFPTEIIVAAYDPTDKFIDGQRPGCIYYLALDFALSGKSGADFSAYFVYEVDKERRVKIVKIERYKGLSYQAQKLRIRELNDVFKPVQVVADEGSFGKSFISDLRALGVPVVGFNFQTRRRELLEVFRGAFDLNFDEGENKHELPLEKKRFLICKDKSDHITNELVDLFTKELESFNVVFKTGFRGDITGTVDFQSTEPHDDLVMAGAMGYWYARGSTSQTLTVKRSSSHRRSNTLFRSVN